MKYRCSFFFLVIAVYCSVSFLATPCHAQLFEQTFSDSVAQFKISTPNGKWTFEPRGSAPETVHATIRFTSPLDQFIPNVTVRITPVAETNPKLEDWLEQELKSLPKSLQVLEKKKMTHQGNNGYEIYLKDLESNIVFLQWFFLAKGRNFVITCTAKETSYSRVFNDFTQILNSFRIM